MNSSEGRLIGTWRQVQFSVAEIDVVTADVDLLVVGMSTRDAAAGARGGASQLDAALHGTLGKLREGGIFDGGFGETMMLAKPPHPIQARTVMLVGMGDPGQQEPARFSELAWLAMRAAMRIHAVRAACLLGWSEVELTSDAVAAAAAGMMAGALRAIDDRRDADDGVPLEWVFDIRNGNAVRTAAALRHTLQGWS